MLFTKKRYSSRRGQSFRKSWLSNVPVHQTRTGRHTRSQIRNAKQQSRKNGTKVRTFVGGFFNKFITDLKNLTK